LFLPFFEGGELSAPHPWAELPSLAHIARVQRRVEPLAPERPRCGDAAAECVRIGLPFTIHTDAPCSNIGTLQLVQTAVMRKCAIDGSVVGSDPAVSLTDAMRAVRIHGAGQIGWERWSRASSPT
jgi:predicted amidohydrolase YtcJ